MTATGQDIEIYQGDDREIYVTTYQEDGVTVLDITGCTLNWVVYKRYSENIVLTKTTGSGITIVNPVNGIFLINLYSSDTENLLGSYNHECELTDSSGNISTIMVGKFTVYRSLA